MNSQKIIVLGTGGTIAGTAADPNDQLSYTAGQVGVDQLARQLGANSAAGFELLTEQVAQVDSKDMHFAIWRDLAKRCAHWLAQSDVRGVIVTHGTDTLEETAYFLHAVLPRALTSSKPVVFTCAMRPASSPFADGPANLQDALAVATDAKAQGVLAVCAGKVHAAHYVQKVHPYRLDAFDSGEAGPLAVVEAGHLRWLAQPEPSIGRDATLQVISKCEQLPRVEIVMSHADNHGLVVDALVQSTATPELRGIVVAATGNGSAHQELEAALLRAQQAGIQIVVATRCAYGQVLPTAKARWSDSAGLSPVKARIAMALSLQAAQ